MCDRRLQGRLLICASSEADSRVLGDILRAEKIETVSCPTPAELAEQIELGAAACIVVDVAVAQDAEGRIAKTLANQPEWSDLPIIVMTSQDTRQDRNRQILKDLGELAQTVLLERPVRIVTLVTTARSALRSRARQYQIRDELERRRQAEEALRESEERLRFVADRAEVGYWQWTTESGAVHWSPIYRRLFGIDADEPMTYARFLSAVHPEDRERVERAHRRHLESRGSKPYDIEYRTVWPDGTLRWIHAKGSAAFEKGQPVRMAGIVLDVTARKRAELALREADRRKDEFLATLAHELRNPLAPIRSGLDVIKALDDPQKLEEVRDTMERPTKQLTTLVNDLLEVSRITRGHLELHRRNFKLGEALRDAVEASQTEIAARRHQLVVTLPDQPVDVNADPHRLTQIISNLLTNAARYTPPEGRIELTARSRGRDVEVSVRDNGIGIPAEMRESIFEMFGRGPRPETGDSDGLGIGLALVASLAKLHGGSAEVHSEGEGQGSEFVVRLPIGIPPQPAAQPAPAAGQEAAAHRRTHRVLVVDDNEAAARMLKMVLELQGHEVLVAGDGLEALEAAERSHPDVVLMDLAMPRMDGYEAARRLRQQDWSKDTLLVALSGWGQKGDRQRTKEAGFDRHLVKPAEPAELQRLLTEFGS